eukprot:TRINITY_DN329_c0_g1_i1.p1 TRINITY_DN329_c0_g1~~TRINITY_DN329_c0_g1_i1.p1  ORF type:complete len:251 (-),score=74.46 TRINITY_DN329_c0_g1_i1:81-797(-)
MNNINSDKLIFESIKKWIPKLTSKSYKGSSGKVGVIGGCKDYTGAPYFSAISSLRVGADIAHVFCTESSSNVIKSFAGDIIVHPTFYTSKEQTTKTKKEIVESVTEWLRAINVLVIGPGLGRDDYVFSCVEDIIVEAKKTNLPLIMDGDFLFHLSSNLKLIEGYEHNVFLTPNVMEYRRLANKVLNGVNPKDNPNPKQNFEITPQQLSEKLGGVTIIAKGENDVIVSGKKTLVSSIEG